MIPRSPLSRVLLAIAALSGLAIVVAYLLAPAGHEGRVALADVAWTWTALYATACCALAWRRSATPEERSTWAWMTAGSASFLGGQLAWNYYELVRRTVPPFPSVADIGFLGIYVFFLVAVVRLLRAQPRRRADPELALDVLLVTFTAGALAYEFLLEPLMAQGRTLPAFLVSLGWSIGGIAVLWMMLVQMIRRTHVPLASAGLVAAGVGLFCVTNIVYAVRALQGAFQSGTQLDLGWDLGLLGIAAAAAIAPERPVTVSVTPPGPGSQAPRLVALVVGLAGVTAIAVVGTLQARPSPSTAALCVAAGMILAVRFALALRADRRYAELLEREVAAQTRSLMGSLSATAAAERNLRLLMESVPEAVVVLDRDGHVLDLNPTAQGLVRGGTRDDAPERSVFDLLEAETAQTVRGHLEAAFQGQVRRFEIPFQRDDGSKGINAVLYAPVREEGVVRRVLALVRDVSDQRRTEAQLAQAEKLAAMGQLVSGVAHEINNPAAIISGFAQTLLLDELPTDQREMVTMIRDEAGRIGRITSNLLAFARAGGRERALVDINDIVRRTFALRSYYLSTLNITVRLELDAAEPKTWANGSELQQLLLNLLINAEQALMQVPPPRGITLRSVATEEEIRLVCGDTGPGIPAEIKGKIFDPFFTTKPEGVGTGLGLSICYGIARDHGGRIGVESDPGAGATFTVVLPRDPRTTPRVEPATAVPAAATGALSVLLVDDEAGLRKAVAKFLRRRGIHVETVGDGAEALTLLARRTFDVIVSDVRMPGVGGREFLDRLKQEHPHLVRRLIFSTGDTFAPDTAILLRDAAAPSIVKPFDFDQLEQLIRRVAGGGEAAAG